MLIYLYLVLNWLLVEFLVETLLIIGRIVFKKNIKNNKRMSITDYYNSQLFIL